MIGPRQRLLLISRDGVEHLVLIEPGRRFGDRTEHCSRFMTEQAPMIKASSAFCSWRSLLLHRIHRRGRIAATPRPPQRAASGGLSIDLSGGGLFTDRMMQIIALITVLSVAPSILIMMTSFVRIVVVLSLLRTALGLQQSPPNSVIVSLAMFLTLFVMTPTLKDAYHQGIEPLMNNQITTEQALRQGRGADEEVHAGAMCAIPI